MHAHAYTLVFLSLDQITQLLEMNFRDYRSSKTGCLKEGVNAKAKPILQAAHGASLGSGGNSSGRFNGGGRLLGQGRAAPARSSPPLWIFALFFWRIFVGIPQIGHLPLRVL